MGVLIISKHLLVEERLYLFCRTMTLRNHSRAPLCNQRKHRSEDFILFEKQKMPARCESSPLLLRRWKPGREAPTTCRCVARSNCNAGVFNAHIMLTPLYSPSNYHMKVPPRHDDRVTVAGFCSFPSGAMSQTAEEVII